MEDFKQYLISREISFEDLIQKDDLMKKQLEKAIVKYFSQLTITDKKSKEEMAPKANTMNNYISHLKCSLSEITGYDFGDKKGKI